MRIGIPKEITPGERRVALVPDAVTKLVNSGVEVLIETGAGEGAHFTDEMFTQAGATLSPDPVSLMSNVDTVLKVQKPILNEAHGIHEIELLANGSTIIAFLQPLNNPELVQMLLEKTITSFSMDTIPRIARAQSMDALSSMSSIAGYKAAIMAANSLAKYFPMMITAAGTYAPARGLVIGAGVAGLQAIATSRRLGAIMHAFDVRPAVKDQVESLGASFIDIPETQGSEDAGGYARELAQESQDMEKQLIHDHAKNSDFIISTALIPGRPAPILITEDTVKGMRPGSVIVDIAAESGGNCEMTMPGDQVIRHGVMIHGAIDLASSMPIHASQMYSRNISNLLLHLIKDGGFHLDFADAITQGCCITHEGKVIYEPMKAHFEKGSYRG